MALTLQVGMGVSSPVLSAEQPKPKKITPPVYPRGAERRGIEGWVDVQYTVAVNGQTDGATVVLSEPPGVFDAAAVKAVQKWTFEPVSESVDGLVTKVRFTLN